jgi:hypothetical protein
MIKKIHYVPGAGGNVLNWKSANSNPPHITIGQWEQRKAACVAPAIFQMHREQIRILIEQL